jgi:hypothetical protein
MTRLKCKKCAAVFEESFGSALLAPHIGPLHYIKCPACKKSSWLNVYSSVKDPLTYPPQEKQSAEQAMEKQLSEEELEQKRIEDSKYEKA